MDLIDLYHNHQGKAFDKRSPYLEIYDILFKEFKNKPVNMLEIGVQNGGSLELWEKYFTNFERMIGCDIDENCKLLAYENTKISVIVGGCNQSDLKKFFDFPKINSQHQQYAEGNSLEAISLDLEVSQKNLTIEKLSDLNEDLTKNHENLQQKYHELMALLHAHLSTKSWKLTFPLRYINKKLKEFNRKWIRKAII